MPAGFNSRHNPGIKGTTNIMVPLPYSMYDISSICPDSMNFTLYNTLTRKKELFHPLQKEEVSLYSCGPTVYAPAHIGNLRAFLFADTLQRWIRFGLQKKVRWVMNITDVDDKTIRGAQETHPKESAMTALQKFTNRHLQKFLIDIETLGIEKNHFSAMPRVTDYIPAQQDLVQKIYENGYAYISEGSVYFSITEYQKKYTYGKLLSLDLQAMKQGSRIDADEYEKDSVHDFVLWKGKKEKEPFWEFQIDGQSLPGRPGWHLECSALEYEILGLPFDIHTGGIDLIFPHHEDEIAQSVGGYNIEPTRYWCHNNHLLVEGEKMSKSLGNFYTLSDLLEKGHDINTLRFCIVTNHYRTAMNLSQESLDMAKNSITRIQNFLFSLEEEGSDILTKHVEQAEQDFINAMNDDLNTSQAIAVVFSLIHNINTITDDSIQKGGKKLRSFFQWVFDIFGLTISTDKKIPSEIRELAKKRQTARKEKRWKDSDILRKTIQEQGWEVRDTQEGFNIFPLD